MELQGYAAVSNTLDAGGDIIRKGAFEETLSQRTLPIPVFWQHNPSQQLGELTHAEETDFGLWVEMLLDVDKWHAKHELLRKKAVDGLSFGYRVTEMAAMEAARPRRRIIHAVDLFEVSIVTLPLNPLARIVWS